MPDHDFIGRATLALDEILRRLTPEQAVQARAIAAEILPSHLRDQINAAAGHAHDALNNAAAAGHFQGRAELPADGVPEWLRLGLLHTYAAWMTGTGSTCTHSPTWERPQPVYSAAWRPDLVVCKSCTHLLNIPRGSDADRRCDGCGHLTTGINHNDGITPAALALGALVYHFGVCGSCDSLTSQAREETA